MLPAPSTITSIMSTAIHLLLSSISLHVCYLHQARSPVSCLQPSTFCYHLSVFMYVTCTKHDHQYHVYSHPPTISFHLSAFMYVTCTKHDHQYHVYSHPPSVIIYLPTYILPAPSSIASIMSTALHLLLSSIFLHVCYLQQARSPVCYLHQARSHT